jgi:hypothetical protein
MQLKERKERLSSSNYRYDLVGTGGSDPDPAGPAFIAAWWILIFYSLLVLGVNPPPPPPPNGNLVIDINDRPNVCFFQLDIVCCPSRVGSRRDAAQGEDD